MSILFLYISNEHMGIEIQNSIIYNYSKIYSGVSIGKCVQNLCVENLKNSDEGNQIKSK